MMRGLSGRSALVLLVLLAAWSASPALAHKVRVFATVEDGQIKGYGYFSKSSRAADCVVLFLDPQGRELGRTKTDAQGGFSFRPTERCDTTLRLLAGEGHQGEFQIRAQELSPDLAPCGESAGAGRPGAGESAPVEKEGRETAPAAVVPAGEDLAKIVSQAVARELDPLKRQVAALREQLRDYEDKVRWHDILGGIGFILGLAGVAALIMGRRKGRK